MDPVRISCTWVHFLSEIDQSRWITAPLPQQSNTLPQAIFTATCSRIRSSFHPLSGLRILLFIHHLRGSIIRFIINFRSGLKHQFTIHVCSCLEHHFFLIVGIIHPFILCVKKKAHQWAHFEKNNKKPGSGSYLLAHGCISWQKLTKFGMRLATCYIYVWYFLQKVKTLTPTCHKRPACPVIWIGFVFIDTWAHFLSKIDKSWCEDS